MINIMYFITLLKVCIIDYISICKSQMLELAFFWKVSKLVGWCVYLLRFSKLLGGA